MTDETRMFQGRVGALDYEKRIVTMKDEQGVQHPFKWPVELDVIMQKWKAGYYLPMEYHEETRVLKSCAYWQEGKDKWPKGQQGSRGQPRNEALIVYQTVYKTNAENIRGMLPMIDWNARVNMEVLTETYNNLMDLVLDRTKKDAAELIRASGDRP